MYKLIFSVRVILFLFIGMIAISCSDRIDEELDNRVNEISLSDDLDTNNKEFCKVLSTSLKDEAVRSFIKEQAMRQVDKDYTVIYHLVKNNEISSGITLRESLAKHASITTERLDEITSSDPTLTILVPYIDSIMNVNTWDPEKKIDIRVVFRPYDIGLNVKELMSYDLNGQEIVIDRYNKPKNQILVVKSNERLLTPTQNNLIKNAVDNSKNALINGDGVFAYFYDEEYNNLFPEIQTKVTTRGGTRHPSYRYDKLMYAYTHNIPYERDYIYYSLKNENSIGTLDRLYAEHLASITFNNTASFNILVKSSDITEGALELHFDFLFMKRDGVGYTLKKVQHIAISDLFIEKDGLVLDVCRYYMHMPLFTWDLYEFGDTYKLSLSEYDNGKEVLITNTMSSTFSSNFKANGNVGLELGPVKLGWGAGGETTETYVKTNVIQTKITENTVALGETYVNFYENSVITNALELKTKMTGTLPYERNIESYDRYIRTSQSANTKISNVWCIKPLRSYNTGTVTLNIVPMKIK